MRSPDICASITSLEGAAAAIAVRDLVALYEVRIDLIGPGWRTVATELPQPWIACNRLPSEGGRASEPESERTGTLREAVELGASMIDIELLAPGLGKVQAWARERVPLIVSNHNLADTPPAEVLDAIVERQCVAGAAVCKVVTTATSTRDNVTMLQLLGRHRHLHLIAFAMGPLGTPSRVLAPLAGAHFIYASLAEGSESAPGQLTVGDLHAMYGELEVRS